jgi:hypothetical protein
MIQVCITVLAQNLKMKNIIVELINLKLHQKWKKTNSLDHISKIISNYNQELSDYISRNLKAKKDNEKFQFINFDNNHNNQVQTENNSEFKIISSNTNIEFSTYINLLTNSWDNCVEECKEILDYLFDISFSKFSKRIKLEVLSKLLKNENLVKDYGKTYSKVIKNLKSFSFLNKNNDSKNLDRFQCNSLNSNSTLINSTEFVMVLKNETNELELQNKDKYELNLKHSNISNSTIVKVKNTKLLENNNYLKDNVENYVICVKYNNKFTSNNFLINQILDINRWPTRFLNVFLYRYITYNKPFFKDIVKNEINYMIFSSSFFNSAEDEKKFSKNDYLKITHLIPVLGPYSNYSKMLYKIQVDLFSKWFEISKQMSENIDLVDDLFDSLNECNSILNKIIGSSMNELKDLHKKDFKEMPKKISDLKMRIEFYENIMKERLKQTEIESTLKSLDQKNYFFYSYDFHDKGIYKNDCIKEVIVEYYFSEFKNSKPYISYKSIKSKQDFSYTFEKETKLFYITFNIAISSEVLNSCSIIRIYTSSDIELRINEELTKVLINNGINLKEYFFYVHFDSKHLRSVIKGLFKDSNDNDSSKTIYFEIIPIKNKFCNRKLITSLFRKIESNEINIDDVLISINKNKKDAKNPYASKLIDSPDSIKFENLIYLIYDEKFRSPSNKCNGRVQKLELCNYIDNINVDCDLACSTLIKNYNNNLQMSLSFTKIKDRYRKEIKDENIKDINEVENNSNNLYLQRCLNNCMVFKWKIPQYKCILKHNLNYSLEETVSKCGGMDNWNIISNSFTDLKDSNFDKNSKIIMNTNSPIEISEREIQDDIKSLFFHHGSNLSFQLSEKIDKYDKIMISTSNMNYFVEMNKEEFFNKNIFLDTLKTNSNYENVYDFIQNSVKPKLEDKDQNFKNYKVFTKIPLSNSSNFIYERGDNPLETIIELNVGNNLKYSKTLYIKDSNLYNQIEIENFEDFKEIDKVGSIKNQYYRTNSGKINNSNNNILENNMNNSIFVKRNIQDPNLFFKNNFTSIDNRMQLIHLQKNLYVFEDLESIVLQYSEEYFRDSFLLKSKSYTNSYDFYLFEDCELFIMIEENTNMQNIGNILLEDGFEEINQSFSILNYNFNSLLDTNEENLDILSKDESNKSNNFTHSLFFGTKNSIEPDISIINKINYHIKNHKLGHFSKCLKDDSDKTECFQHSEDKGTNSENNNFISKFKVFKRNAQGNIKINYDFLDFDDLEGILAFIVIKPLILNNKNNVNQHKSKFSCKFCFFSIDLPTNLELDENFIEDLKSDSYPAKQKQVTNVLPIKEMEKLAINNCKNDKSNSFGLLVDGMKDMNSKINSKTRYLTRNYLNKNLERAFDSKRLFNYKDISIYKDFTISTPKIKYHRSFSKLYVLDRFGNLFYKDIMIDKYTSNGFDNKCLYNDKTNSEPKWNLINNKIIDFELNETTLIVIDFFKNIKLQKDLLNYSLPYIQLKFLWSGRIKKFILTKNDCLWAVDSVDNLIFSEKIIIVEPYDKEDSSRLNEQNKYIKFEYILEVNFKQSIAKSIPSFKSFSISFDKLIIIDRLNKIFVVENTFDMINNKCIDNQLQRLNSFENLSFKLIKNNNEKQKSDEKDNKKLQSTTLKINKIIFYPGNNYFLIDTKGILYFRNFIMDNNLKKSFWEEVISVDNSTSKLDIIVDCDISRESLFCIKVNGKMIVYNQINYPQDT